MLIRSGHEVRAPHRQPAHRIGQHILVRLEVVVAAGVAVREVERAIEDELHVVDEVHLVGRRRAAIDQCWRARRIDQAMVRIERDREQRALLPLERLLLAALAPDLGGAAAFDDEANLLKKMALGVERTARGDLDDVLAPQPLGAEQLDIAAATTEPLPGCERQVEHGPDADVAVDRNALALHELVVGHRRARELAFACDLAGLGLVPVIGCIMRHGGSPVVANSGNGNGATGRPAQAPFHRAPGLRPGPISPDPLRYRSTRAASHLLQQCDPVTDSVV